MVNILPLFLSLRSRQWPNAVNGINTHFMVVGNLISLPLTCPVVLFALRTFFLSNLTLDLHILFRNPNIYGHCNSKHFSKTFNIPRKHDSRPPPAPTMAVSGKNMSVVKKGALWDKASSCRRGLKVKLHSIGVEENIKNQ